MSRDAHGRPATAPTTPTRQVGQTGPMQQESTESTRPPPGAQRPRRPRRPLPQLPEVPAWVAALATGLLAGLAGVLLVLLGLLGCEAVRGAPSCGDAGYPLLAAIVIAVGVGAMLLLRFARVADAGVISFIATCSVLVVLMLGLLDLAFSAWMWVVLPALGAAAFVATTLLVHALAGGDTRGDA